MWVRRASEPLHFRWLAHQQVETRIQAVHPMNEQGEVNGRLPWQNVPGHRASAQVALDSRHDASQHGEETAGRDRSRAIERESASSLADYLCRARRTRVAR